MRKFIVSLLLLAAAQASHAGCDQREYSQYKDKSRTPRDQLLLARQYCLAKDLWDIYRGPGGSGREAEQCSTEMTKMLDALSAANAHAAISHIEKTCPFK